MLNVSVVLKWDVLPKNSKSSDLEFFYPLRKQWHIINDSVAIVVSHQSVRTVYHHALACIKNTFAMMIYKTSFWWYAISAKLIIYTASPWFILEFEVIHKTAENIFFYPSRRLGISSAPAGLDIITATPCISSRASVYPPAAWWYTTLRVDDMQFLRNWWYTRLRLDFSLKRSFLFVGYQ